MMRLLLALLRQLTENDSSFVTDLTAGQTDPEDDDLSVASSEFITAVDGNGDSYTLPANTASVSGNNLTVDPNPDRLMAWMMVRVLSLL